MKSQIKLDPNYNPDSVIRGKRSEVILLTPEYAKQLREQQQKK